MSENLKTLLQTDDGMKLYEYIVNHVDEDDEAMTRVIDRMRQVDLTGQFLCSTARYLYALDPKGHEAYIRTLIDGAIERDREHRYIGSLLEALWGKDYEANIEKLSESDDGFRRIYKRIYSHSI